jgi:toxin ParE1/3/4
VRSEVRPAAHREVLLTHGAEQDLESLHNYLAQATGNRAAQQVLARLLRAIEALSSFPERGGYPRELLALGIRDYRQIALKPYRVIYRVIEGQVIVYLVVDGRRDLGAVLARRLLLKD